MSSRWLAVAASLGLLGTLASCSSGADEGRSQAIGCGERGTVAYATHEGVDPHLTSLDLYRPDASEGRCDRRPLVVWVHGGAWHEGDKSDHIEDKVRLFNDRGYVLASVNYRLTDDEVDPPAPQHPVHDQDVADAIAWLIEHGERYGIDADRLAVLGHSAGGGIAAAVAIDGTYLGSNRLGPEDIRCAGSIDGEGYDIVAGAEHPDPQVHDPYLEAFGTDPAIWRSASPIEHIAPDAGIADWFVVARGPAGRLDLHRRFVEALRDADVPTTVVDAAELDHAEVATEIGSPQDDVVTPALEEFLAVCFR